jgi:hypothetical protein
MPEPYDSTADTREHIKNVREGINTILENLETRSVLHDRSKLQDPEKACFDIVTPKLKHLKYGSEEYRAELRAMKPALDHHYAANDHHPEHFGEDGILGMSLMAILEMLADWRAAGMRHDPPNPLSNSIAYNSNRFKMPPYLTQIFYTTAKELGWL